MEPLTTVNDREKALLRPIDGPFKEFAQEVRRLMGYYAEERRPFLTSRMASRKTGVNYSTIASMTRGVRGSEETIRKIASGLGGRADHLLRLAGYESFPADLLSQIGPDVDISAIADIRLSPFLVSAGDGFVPPEPGLEHETIESILPGQIRAIRVTGDCMAPLYQDGDVVFVREQGNAENGNKVIALVDDDKLNCKVYRTNGEAYLEPKNGEGRIPASRFHILGVVVGVFRRED